MNYYKIENNPFFYLPLFPKNKEDIFEYISSSYNKHLSFKNRSGNSFLVNECVLKDFDLSLNIPFADINDTFFSNFLVKRLIDNDSKELNHFSKEFLSNIKIKSFFNLFIDSFNIKDIYLLGFIKNNSNVNYIRDKQGTFHFSAIIDNRPTLLAFGYYANIASLYIVPDDHILLGEDYVKQANIYQSIRNFN